jgi:hypothetical protein
MEITWFRWVWIIVGSFGSVLLLVIVFHVIKPLTSYRLFLYDAKVNRIGRNYRAPKLFQVDGRHDARLRPFQGCDQE